MGKGARNRVTARDIAQAEGGVAGFAKSLVKTISDGIADDKEAAVGQLRSLATQNHGEHRELVFKSGAIKPLVELLKTGSARAQEAAAGTLHTLAHDMADYQATIVDAGGIPPLVNLLKTGSAKVQEEAASALASIDVDVSHQAGIIKAGAIPPLVTMLKGGSAAAQAFAAQATANAAAYSHQAQTMLAGAGCIPLLLPHHMSPPLVRAPLHWNRTALPCLPPPR